MRIVSYSLEQVGDCIGIKRYANYKEDVVIAMCFKDAAEYLTEKVEGQFIVCWNMDKFAKILFGMLPQATQETLINTNKAFFDGYKIFYVGRLMGLTDQTYCENIKDKKEVNIYPLNSWLSEERDEPEVKELAELGEQVLEAMDTLGIPVTTLTSPAGLYSKHLVGKVPTIYSNPSLKQSSAFKDACNACLPVMNLEWVQKYQSEKFAPTYTYDLASAYPSFMVNLPNTDKCKVTFSKEVIPAHWAIVKVANLNNVPEINPLVNLERDMFASSELKWLKAHGATFDVVEGHYVSFQKDCTHPYDQPIKTLWETRQKGGILAETAKRMMNGLSGKTSQQNNDGTFGELYNPIYSTMILTSCRLECMRFIEEHKLEKELVEVHVDAVKSYRDLNLPRKSNMGEWRQQD